jgi:hypothetical protein
MAALVVKAARARRGRSKSKSARKGTQVCWVVQVEKEAMAETRYLELLLETPEVAGRVGQVGQGDQAGRRDKDPLLGYPKVHEDRRAESAAAEPLETQVHKPTAQQP